MNKFDKKSFFLITGMITLFISYMHTCLRQIKNDSCFRAIFLEYFNIILISYNTTYLIKIKSFATLLLKHHILIFITSLLVKPLLKMKITNIFIIK